MCKECQFEEGHSQECSQYEFKPFEGKYRGGRMKENKKVKF